jgi:hypothetical protein
MIQGQIPRCHGRERALDRTRTGLLANVKVSGYATEPQALDALRVAAHPDPAPNRSARPPTRESRSQ